jgi:hypothetical protein
MHNLILVGNAQQILNYLKFKICRNRSCLLAHIQRIITCFQNQFQEQLLGALLDLFIALPGKRGYALKKRMLYGAKPGLPAKTFLLFAQELQSQRPIQLCNQYSLLTQGLVSTNKIVRITEKERWDYDPLQIARDYIEYSQLDEAKSILINAILSTPEHLELHIDLLELYRLTQDYPGFINQHAALQLTDPVVQKLYQDTELFFNEQPQLQ